jgi:hypothetical protein
MLDDKRKNARDIERLPERSERNAAHAGPEEMVFCDCDHSYVNCSVERWKICKRRIQKDAAESTDASGPGAPDFRRAC